MAWPNASRRKNELLGTELQSVVLLALGVGYSIDFSTESVGPHECELSETADTDDGYFLAWPGARPDERRVSR